MVNSVYEKHEGETWKEVDIKNLQKGDIYRISQNGKYVELWKGSGTMFVAWGNPYQYEDEWVIECNALKQKYIDRLKG